MGIELHSHGPQRGIAGRPDSETLSSSIGHIEATRWSLVHTGYGHKLSPPNLVTKPLLPLYCFKLQRKEGYPIAGVMELTSKTKANPRLQ